MSPLVEISEEYLELNFEEVFEKVVENGETFLIRTKNGKSVVMTPKETIKGVSQSPKQSTDDEWYNIYRNHNEGS